MVNVCEIEKGSENCTYDLLMRGQLILYVKCVERRMYSVYVKCGEGE